MKKKNHKKIRTMPLCAILRRKTAPLVSPLHPPTLPRSSGTKKLTEKRRRKQDLPTEESPIKRSLNR